MEKTFQFKHIGVIAVFILGVLSLGHFGRAEAQVTASPIQPACTTLSYNLGIGDYDAMAVTELQSYLDISGYMNHAPTGYFGSLTYAAVVSYQENHGIPGTGFVGPLTRASIQAQTCGGNPTPTPPPYSNTLSIQSINPQSGPVGTNVTITGRFFTATNTIMFGGGAISNVPVVYAPCVPAGSFCSTGFGILNFTVPSSIGPYCAPGMACPMYMQLVTPGTYPISVMNANGTSNSVNFTVTGGNPISGGPLSISGIDAPNSIPLGTPGTWTIHASGGQSSDLHYSVVWGDEASGVGGFEAPTANPIDSSATFTHTYIRAGTYDPSFTVTDDFGHSVTANASVLVTPLYQ